jgi:hypothetical protein
MHFLLKQVITSQARGLKPGAFKLWVNWIQLVQPHQGAWRGPAVAVQVEFKKTNFEAKFSIHRLKG